MHHLHPTLFQRPDKLLDPLYVVTTVFNSQRFRSRWRLFEDFIERVLHSGSKLIVVEVAFGKRKFVFPTGDECGPLTIPLSEDFQILQLRTSHELWLKENAINLGVQRLPE